MRTVAAERVGTVLAWAAVVACGAVYVWILIEYVRVQLEMGWYQ